MSIDTRPTEDLGSLLRERVPGMPLAGPFYTSPEIFEADLATIFGQHWFFAATEAEIPEPGDYVTITLGTTSVIVLRDDDEQVRAFHNVCRHRGARLLPERSGSVGNLVCGYHSWTYGTDGRLLFAPGQPAGLDPSCWGLRTVPLRSISGLVFLCLAAEPPADLEDVAARLTPYLEKHRLTDAKVAAQVDLVEDGNWKLVMENNRECYHCDGHPELSATFFLTYGLAEDEVPERLRPDHERYLAAERDLLATCARLDLPHTRIEELSAPATGFRVQREPLDGRGESFSTDGAALCRRLLGHVDTTRLGRLSIHTQPNAWFHVMSDHAVVFSVLPLAADRTLVRTTWLVDQDAVEGVDYDVDALTHVWRETNAQDGAFVARAQEGVSSPAYTPGPYMPSEYQVDEFVTWYVARMCEATP
ncbi:aromatic ring-hydroxylating dioxygenase subunit alpha [Ornithinimicrobium sp. LYQ92]|uniref:aromatic ring-hydroxylating oxygenase subunit alpha n=1 Tax=Serinicoccus sp. LYQ92 TaxID=3378798 RepID=UPI0038532E72